ncbi:MAG: hypothetical protein IT447_07770 [Phycisphaerales bacterium]|jgi:hypothetical protein|nr:hypothetical protein [Phycisphaerales bacterium]
MNMCKWMGGFFVWAVLFGSGGAMAQFGNSPQGNRPSGQLGYEIDTDNPSLLIFPGLRTAPAPDWVKPGLRLSFYCASATIPSSHVGGMVQDPTGKWVDPTTGKTYRMEEGTGAAGHGYNQLEVVSMTDDAVVFEQRFYVFTDISGPVKMVSAVGSTTVPGAAADWWMNPEVLNREIVNLGEQGHKTYRTPYKAAGNQYDAVWINTTAGGGSMSYVMDLASGLTLHTGSRTSAASSVTNLNGVPTNVGGYTTLGQTTFVGMRQIQAPWIGMPIPRSFGRMRQLVFEGQSVVTVEGVSAKMPMQVTIDITGRGPGFVQTKKKVKIDYNGAMPPQENISRGVSGSHQLLPLCIPPQALARLRSGQKIDQDPITKVNTFVSFIGQDPSGNDVVTITEFIANNAVRTDYVYDMTNGILCAVQMTDPPLHTQNTLYRVR